MLLGDGLEGRVVQVVGIAALMVALDQGGGALVSLLGSRVCVGWNLTRATQAHAKNAVRFVQRLHDGTSVAGAGRASGPVEHGDVGTRTQRFMTVMGPSVHRSWTLCEEAVDEGRVCLHVLRLSRADTLGVWLGGVGRRVGAVGDFFPIL